MKKVFLTLAFITTLVTQLLCQTPEKPLTNEDVIKLVQAKLTDSLILKKINGSKTAFDLSSDGIVNLKKNHVSEAIMESMMLLSSTLKASSTTHSGLGSATSNDSGSSTSALGLSTKPFQVTRNNFVFELVSCFSNGGDSITCSLRVKNVADVERSIRMVYNTYMKDEEFNNTQASEQFIGSKHAGNGIYDRNKMYGRPDGSIKPGDTTTATVVFEKLKGIPKIIQLSISLSSNWDGFSAEFSGVPISTKSTRDDRKK